MSRTEKKLPPTPPLRSSGSALKAIADGCIAPPPTSNSPVVGIAKDKRSSVASSDEQGAQRIPAASSATTPDGSTQTVTKADLEHRLAQERERFEMVIAEERKRYETMLEEMRVAFQSQVESLRAGLSAATKPDRSMSGLIAKLFADRPAEKRDAWIKRLEEQEVRTIDAASQLKPEGWDRLNLPLGVTETLKDAVKPPPLPVAPPASSRGSSQGFDAGFPKMFAFGGQPDVILTKMAAVTSSGCGWKGCNAEFDFTYDATICKYRPKQCPKCMRDIHPPKRLIDIAQAHLSAKATKHEIGNKIAAVAAKSAIRTGAAYVPYASGVVSAVGEAAIDEVSK